MRLSELNQVVFGAKVAAAPVKSVSPQRPAIFAKPLAPIMKTTAPVVMAKGIPSVGAPSATRVPMTFAKASGAAPAAPPPAPAADAGSAAGSAEPQPVFTTSRTVAPALAPVFTVTKVVSKATPVMAMFAQPTKAAVQPAQPDIVAPGFESAGPLRIPKAVTPASDIEADCAKRGGSWTGKECVFKPAAPPAEPPAVKPEGGTTVIDEKKVQPTLPQAEPVGVGDRGVPQGSGGAGFQYDTSQQKYAAPGEFQAAEGEEPLPEVKVVDSKTAEKAKPAVEVKGVKTLQAKIPPSTGDNKVKYGLGILIAAGVGYFAYLKFKKHSGETT